MGGQGLVIGIILIFMKVYIYIYIKYNKINTFRILIHVEGIIISITFVIMPWTCTWTFIQS